MNCKAGIHGKVGRYGLLAAMSLLLWPATADAHLMSTGLGPFYDGMIHLILSPDDLLGVLAIALLSGLAGARYGRAVLFTLSAAWLLGGLLGLLADTEVGHYLFSRGGRTGGYGSQAAVDPGGRAGFGARSAPRFSQRYGHGPGRRRDPGAFGYCHGRLCGSGPPGRPRCFAACRLDKGGGPGGR